MLRLCPYVVVREIERVYEPKNVWEKRIKLGEQAKTWRAILHENISLKISLEDARTLGT